MTWLDDEIMTTVAHVSYTTLFRHGSLGHLQGGVIMLRPCPAIAQHMGALLMRDRLLQFQYAHAEQVWRWRQVGHVCV